MALERIEKLHTSIVILPSGDFQPKIGLGTLGQLIKDPEIVPLPAPMNITRITSLRDQVEITIGQGRIQIQDHSGVQPGTPRFAEIVTGLATHMAEVADVTYRAYGWNFDVAFSFDSGQLPAKVIADRFMNVQTIKSLAGLDIIGAGIRFFYHKGRALCYLYLEPRGDVLDASTFYAHINVHTEIAGVLPAGAELQASFDQEYAEFIQSVEKMLT